MAAKVKIKDIKGKKGKDAARVKGGVKTDSIAKKGIIVQGPSSLKGKNHPDFDW